MKIALAGQMGSGKSSVAKELEKRGFYLLNYKELIKEEVAKAMAAVGVRVTSEEALEKIHTDKEFYRPLLIAWADTTGWSDASRLETFLKELDKENIVLDNVRLLVQAEMVRVNGFIVIKLQGGNASDFLHEHDLDQFNFDAEIAWEDTVEQKVDKIIQVATELMTHTSLQ